MVVGKLIVIEIERACKVASPRNQASFLRNMIVTEIEKAWVLHSPRNHASFLGNVVYYGQVDCNRDR